MPAPTDLSWAQFGQALGEVLGSQIFNATMTVTPEGVSQIIFTVEDLTPFREYFNNPNIGVVKAFARSLAAGRIAQERINENKQAGEKLAAFPAPVTGAVANGYAPVTRTVASRVDLGSAVAIIGTTA